MLIHSVKIYEEYGYFITSYLVTTHYKIAIHALVNALSRPSLNAQAQ